MAKGQQKSNREAKKPKAKKTATVTASSQFQTPAKTPPAKTAKK